MVSLKKTPAIAAVAAVALIVPSFSAGSVTASKTYHVTAALSPRNVVTPQNKRWTVPAALAKANGTFGGRLTVTGGRRSLSWHLDYAHLGRSALKIADIHLGKPGKFGPILIRLCAPCRTGESGTKKLTAAAANAISTGGAWLTVITGQYANGAIRGQIKATAT